LRCLSRYMQGTNLVVVVVTRRRLPHAGVSYAQRPIHCACLLSWVRDAPVSQRDALVSQREPSHHTLGSPHVRAGELAAAHRNARQTPGDARARRPRLTRARGRGAQPRRRCARWPRRSPAWPRACCGSCRRARPRRSPTSRSAATSRRARRQPAHGACCACASSQAPGSGMRGQHRRSLHGLLPLAPLPDTS